MRASRLVGLFVSGAIACACGGAAGSNLFGESSSSDAGAAGSGQPGTGSSGSGGAAGGNASSSGSGSSGSSSGGNTGSSSSGSGGGSGSSSSGGGSGGSGSSSGGSSSGGSSSGSSSGGGYDDAGHADPGIACGTTSSGAPRYCEPTSQICCAAAGGSGGGGAGGGGGGTGSGGGGGGSAGKITYSCMSNTTGACEDGNDTALPCSDSAQCPGAVCCGTLDTSGQYFNVGCQTTCDPTQSEYTFCDPSATPDVCASIPANGGPAFTCQASAILTGYYVCNNGTTPNPSP